MPTRTPRRTIAATMAAVAMLLVSIAPAGAADPTVVSTRTFTVKQLVPDSKVSGAKSASGRLAESDSALVARTDARPVNVVIKLDYDAVASYAGDVDGLKATSPRVTGHPLDLKSSAVTAYRTYIKGREDAFVKALQTKVPSSVIGTRLETVYGGIAAVVPARSVKTILKLPGVVAVQADTLEHPLTDASATFIDADPVYADLGTTANAGQGIIFGSLDTGVWPEHPSFEDQGNLSAPPGPARVCDFGIDPLTSDPFACDNKLIGGQPFLTTYLSDPTRAAGETYTTARDSDGHGTHTSSTAAGNVVESAPVLGVDRGPIHGMAPGAWVMVYKVCGQTGCFSSDSAAAVGQAIVDGVDVINFSISGGTDPMTDPVELAFLDAYNAGVVVAASAGNDGPTAATANHLSPWTISVAASTQTRTFQSTLTLTDGPATATFTGASITAGVGPLPIVFASAAPYNDEKCENPATAGMFTGKIVACERGTNARVDKGFNVKQGNAAGMVLYNPTLADVETDNHWLPAVHLADGTAFVAFLTAHPGATATIGAGVKAAGQGDVMAAFSSRGPAGLFIKPDVTAPGVQILAGDSPTPDATDLGPPGELYQAIAGTSMASPHVAGAAILVRAEHPFWTPGQIKSALMGTAVTAVKKEDLTTPADPFDFGAGRIDVAAAVAAPLTFDESAADFFATSADPLHAIDLNIGSIDAPVMPGLVTTTRVAKNPTNKTLTYAVSTTSPSHSSITVSPSKFTLAPGKSVTLHVTIASTATIGTQQFGAIKIVTTVGVGSAAQIRRIHIPVAFVHAQGDVSLSQTCSPSTIKVGNTSVCTVTAENDSFSPQQVTVETRTDGSLKIVSASHATIIDNHTARSAAKVLEGAQPGVPSVAPGDSVFGYIPLDSLGVTPTPIGDEDIINFPTGHYLFNGVTYDSIGVDSNGYILAGEGTSADDVCCDLPSAASPDIPNDILAPFWTDLDGTDSDGIFVAELSDAGQTWLVVEHRVDVFGTSDLEVFQTWIGENDAQDISYAYDPTNLPTQPADVGQTFLVGAENGKGEGDMSAFIPTEDLVVTSTAAIPGDSLSYRVRVKGLSVGSGLVKTQMTASETLGLTIVRSTIAIKKK